MGSGCPRLPGKETFYHNRTFDSSAGKEEKAFASGQEAAFTKGKKEKGELNSRREDNIFLEKTLRRGYQRGKDAD